MSTPRTKYSKKQPSKKENRDLANSKEDKKDNGAGNSGATKVLAVTSTLSCVSAPCCRICHDDDMEEPLISPCNCKGSMNYCHASCLRFWLTEKVQNLKEPSCEICKCAYEVRYERVGKRDCSVPLRQLRGQREFLIISFCMLELVASIGYTTWAAFSTSKLAINFRMSPLAELTYSVYFIIDVLCVLVIAVEFNVGIWPIVKKWWKSNLSVIVIDKNNVAIYTENLRVVEEASSLLEDEEEAEEEEAEEEDDQYMDEERGEARGGARQERGGGDEVARVSSGWWIKLWTCRGQANSGEREREAVELGDAPIRETHPTMESTTRGNNNNDSTSIDSTSGNRGNSTSNDFGKLTKLMKNDLY